MENISPISTDGESRDYIAPLDNLLRPTQHNARASRLKHGPSRSIVSPISRNVDIGRLYLPPMSGTMTPPSQVLDDCDASRMLISPPPEETLRVSGQYLRSCKPSILTARTVHSRQIYPFI